MPINPCRRFARQSRFRGCCIQEHTIVLADEVPPAGLAKDVSQLVDQNMAGH